MAANDSTTLVDVLRERGHEEPGRRTFTFLENGETQESRLTNRELDHRARAIASVLRDRGLAGERALLLYPPGLPLVTAVFGCLYAGTVAVLPYPPDPARLDRTLPRLQAIAEDAGARVLLTTAETTAADIPRLRSLPRLATDHVDLARARTWREPGPRPEDLALLQYTSGSTDQPKGVMLTHRNVTTNLACQRSGWLATPDSHAVIWLPPYHDMGLFGGIFLWLYAGATVTLMSPSAFLQRPARWLRAVSRTRATHIGAPDFAYALCADKIGPEEREGLRLDSLRVAWNGAETVRPETRERFTEAFRGQGFRPEAFLPSYGLAEATLLVAATDRRRTPAPDWHRATRHADVGARPGGIASCGPPVGDQRVVIVDPRRRTRCAPGEEGEIWVGGPSVAAGYWRHPDETARTFHATLADGTGPFLRTGDLGFLSAGELFVTSRLKDLIVIRGRNIHPLDVERTAEASHPDLRPGAAAAFSVDAHGAERVVVVQEVREPGTAPPARVAAAVREAVAAAHDIQPYAVVLIAARSIHKTSSGKIQRRRTRESYLAGTLAVVCELRDTAAGGDTRGRHGELADRQGIEDWLVTEIARVRGVDPAQVDVGESFLANGLDSASSIALTGELASALGRALPDTLTWDYPNITALAEHLAGTATARG